MRACTSSTARTPNDCTRSTVVEVAPFGPTRLDRVESRFAISDLITAYAIACDEHDMPRLTGLFTADAVFDSPSGAMVAHGRAAIEAFLVARREQLAAAGIRHRVVDLVIDQGRGAFLGEVRGPDGSCKPFMVWFELRDGLIGRYLLRPL